MGAEDSGRCGDHLVKAGEFLRAAQEDAARRRWNAASLLAVHAGISAAYAMLIAEQGLSLVARGYEDLLELLAESGADRCPPLVYLRRLLTGKNLIEHRRRLFSQREAERFVKDAARFLAWARGRVRPAAS